jgi:hypothetical protein
MWTKNNGNHAKLVATGALMATMLLSAHGEAETHRVYGTYHYTKSFEHGRGVILGAFESPIKSIPFLFRPLVRSRIHRSNLMIRTFDISRSGQNIVFRALAPSTWTWDLTPGVPEQVRTPAGNMARMTHRLQGGTYVQSFQGRNMTQRMRYVLSRNGHHMRVNFVINASFADEPIAFSLLYRKANEQS